MPFLPVPKLSPGDAVAVVAPAGPFDRASFEAGLAVLSRRYPPRFDEGLFSAERYLAGNDERRGKELERALQRPDVRGVFSARGGYGVARLLSALPLVWSPRPVVGFSDLTSLHAHVQRAGQRSLHAPVLTQLGKQPLEVVERVFEWLESSKPGAPLHAVETLVPGAAEGPLLGGNLSVLTRLLGTPWMPKLDGAVLFLEDVGERPYRLDRMWTHLRLAGALEHVAGIALGEFTGCEEKDAVYSSRDVLAELAHALGKPCALGFPVGHGAINWPLALGARVRLEASQKRLDFLEGLVA